MEQEMYDELMGRMLMRVDMADATEFEDILIIARPTDEPGFITYYETDNVAQLLGIMEIAKADILNDTLD